MVLAWLYLPEAIIKKLSSSTYLEIKKFHSNKTENGQNVHICRCGIENTLSKLFLHTKCV